ncbi:GAF domain-containing protein [Halovivax limisalsi]|uniref:GAF domain-containing protein n=1 Tax=Halovivax limisalsi TaxID=1453760 RepID=UPI001FFD605B|nr:GAF domain-containing protein [Halovivax limisalsi]
MNNPSLTEALRETLTAFDGSTEPLTTVEVAQRLDVGRRSAYERLERLADRDVIETKKVGASARVWWSTPRERGESRESTDAHRNCQVSNTATQFDRFVEAVTEYAIFTLDPDGRVESWNAGAERIKGYAADEIVGRHIETFYTDEAVADDVPERNLAAAAREGSIEDEGWRVRADGSRFWANVTITAIRAPDGTLQGYTKVTRDMTDRRNYERELEDRAERFQRQRDELERELEAVFSRISDGVYGLDEDRRLTYANAQAKSLLDVDAEVQGVPLEEAVDVTETFDAALERARARQEPIVEEEQYGPSETWFEYTIYPSESGVSVYVRDVSARKRRERRLRKRVEQQDVIARLGQRALDVHDLDALLADAAEAVAETLDNEYCKVLDLRADDDELLLRQGVGWDEGIVGEATVSATANESQAAYTLATDEPVVVESLADEERFSGPALLTDHDVESGISVVIGQSDDPWGILGVHDTEERSISENDASFVRAVAAILASAIDRNGYERELLERRERLEAINGLNEVVRDLTNAIIDQSTREEIERTVVERLADAESYEFAWVGDADLDTGTVTMRAEAGVEDYLDGTIISIDPDDAHSAGPTGRAFRTGTVQVTRDVDADERYGPWRDHAATHDFRASAAIPIVHEETVYGVLNVYADRQQAFADEERAVVELIGEVIGHAIAATERKQALVSDEVVELEFRLPNAFRTVDADIDMAGSITVENVVQRAADEFSVYGTVTPDGVSSLEALAESAPDWYDLTIRRSDETIRFGVRLSEPTILSTIASRGGYVEEAVVEDGAIQLTVQLSPHVDVRAFVYAMESIRPEIELLRRTQ